MPFISNDFEWKLVEDDEPYDKEQFVVVRKLHVKPYKYGPINEVSFDLIDQRFRKFGEIESIEISPNKKSAHVTFSSNYSAYWMQLKHDFDKMMDPDKKMPFEIRPANSWNQPSENAVLPPYHDVDMEGAVPPPEIFILNEDCLLHLFKFLDLDSLVNMAYVCKMFRELLDTHCFPHIRKFEFKSENHFDGYDPRLFSMSLVKMRRTLRCIGPFITDLTFQCNAEENNRTKYSVFKHDIISRFLEVLAEKIGPNIRRAWFSGILLFEEDGISRIAPILHHLEMLKIEGNYSHDGYADIDFQTLCPNLIDFELNAPVPMTKTDKPWSTLRRLACVWDEDMEPPDMQSFFEWNPQLTCVQFRIWRSLDGDISVAAVNLPLLEKIGIYDDFENFCISGQSIACLNSLQYLMEVTMHDLDENCLESVIDCLKTMVRLRKIHLHLHPIQPIEFEEEYEQSLVKLARQLPNLEHFALDGVTITEVNLIKFVRFANQLKTLKLCYCKVGFTDKLILKLVKVLECNRSQPSDALLLELDRKEFENLNVIENESMRPYLKIEPVKSQ
ncbi:uncharacterized protein LOC129567384 [Sitodiplosis mosellana]|uniref:uncharacterized protein LOC129567384 n=1 Tax=Sitodiplosis mosellana TaxID=263140 RepID=UPI0024441F74|nr:uncharacterized protein LOC129567384 [Sitodiplosis mosellana]